MRIQVVPSGITERYKNAKPKKVPNQRKKGSLLWELLIVLAILFAFIYTAMSFLGVYVQFESLSYAAKTVARQIEVTGKYDAATVQENISILTDNTNLHDVTYDIEVGPIPADTSSTLAASLSTSQRLQLRQQFTITLSAVHTFHLIGSSDESILSEWTIDIPMTYKVTGMSEVFWRE